jgi:hypothetical protein
LQANPAEPQPLCSSSSNSSTSAGNLAEWLAAETLTLDNPAAWQTLPVITHAPGCEAYAAAAVASSSSSSLVHEAGYDAFITGVLFVGLLRLFQISELSQRSSRWQLPLQPIVPPGLEAVQQYSWRQYHAKGKDVQYAALQVRIIQQGQSSQSMNCSFIGAKMGCCLLFVLLLSCVVLLVQSSC